MKLSEFDYLLPPELIAQKPTEKRDRSRLLIVSKTTNGLEDKLFSDLPKYLKKGDLLVINNSKVFPARLLGHKKSGGKAEILLEHINDNDTWQVLGKKLKVGDKVNFPGSDLEAEILSKKEKICCVRFNKSKEEFFTEVEKTGHTPLPPYIKRDKESPLDAERYQTVYAKDRGSVAAPTAGLHFTKNLFREIKDIGVEIAEVTLHVGLGTFMPVETEKIEDHEIHSEYYSVKKSEYEKIILAKKAGRRVISVGTTSARTLETIFSNPDAPLSGWTSIFIYPGFKFQCVDGLITNFHLPKSSLLMLVSALVGRDKLFQSYEHAIQKKYRFYSYGDAMLII